MPRTMDSKACIAVCPVAAAKGVPVLLVRVLPNVPPGAAPP